MTYVDTDKGGNYNYGRDRTLQGPTVGEIDKATNLQRTIISGTSSTIQPWDSIILFKLSPNGIYTLNLLSVSAWLSNAYGQVPVLIKFLNDNGGNALTIVPAGADLIDGLAQVTITPTINIAPFPSALIRPLSDLSGWIVG